MNVRIFNVDRPELGVTTIPLPIPDEEYDHCMELLNALEIGGVTAHDCYVDQINDAPPSLFMLEGTMVNVDELDFLARSLERFADEELAKFQCMIATKEQWDMQTLINLSFSCEQTTVITDFSKLEKVGKSHYMTTHGGGVPVEEYRQLNGIGIARMLIADGEGKRCGGCAKTTCGSLMTFVNDGQIRCPAGPSILKRLWQAVSPRSHSSTMVPLSSHSSHNGGSSERSSEG